MPRAFTIEERELLKTKLIAVGKRLLNRVGIRGVIIDDAAREAGISKGSFYSFFSSREEYLLSIFESWETEYRGLLLKEVLEGEGPPRERFERFFAGVFAIFDREPGLARFNFSEIMGVMERLPAERLSEHQSNDERVLEDAAERWVGAGLIDGSDAPALEGVMDSLFILGMHREDFKKGAYEPAMKLIGEALALRLAARSVMHES